MAKKAKPVADKKKEKAKKDYDEKHNICMSIDESAMKAEHFSMLFPFLRRSRIFHAANTHCPPYTSIIRAFWDNAVIHREKNVVSIKSKVQGKKVMITEQIIREVLRFNDHADDPRAIDERCVKGCFQRMGYTGPINAAKYGKALFPRPYKLLIHIMMHVFGHRKGGYDDVLDYIMCAITALCLNLKYNFSNMVFKNMRKNVNAHDKWLLYPRFLQMIIENQVKNLVKDEKDVLKQAHMTTGTFGRLYDYRGKGDDYPRFRRLFGHLASENYVAPENNEWRHENSDSENEKVVELERMQLFKPVDKFISVQILDSDEEDDPKKPKKRKRTPRVKIRTRAVSDEPEPVKEIETANAGDEVDKDTNGDDSDSNESFSKSPDEYVVKSRAEMVDEQDETYVPENDPELIRKNKGKGKKAATKKRKIVEIIDEEFQNLFKKNLKEALKQSRPENEPPPMPSMPHDTEAGSSAQQAGASSLQISEREARVYLDFDLFADESTRKDIAELRQIIGEQNVKIGSLTTEVDRLRRENVSQQERLQESENRRVIQADLLNQYMKYFKVLEKKLNINLAEESEEALLVQVMSNARSRSRLYG